MSAILETDFLQQLGERVRAWRTEHATTRRALASASGVSERFLAQLEAGQGNISVLRLRALARAMRVPLESLVREAQKRELVALIGMRGAGKSTLSAKLGEVFAMYGQDAFRRFERRALERVLAQHPRAVIAAGGSLVTAADTYQQ